MKACPFCAEDIQDAAIVCKHCGRDLVPAAAAIATPPTPPVTTRHGFRNTLLVIGALFVLLVIIVNVNISDTSTTPPGRTLHVSVKTSGSTVAITNTDSPDSEGHVMTVYLNGSPPFTYKTDARVPALNRSVEIPLVTFTLKDGTRFNPFTTAVTVVWVGGNGYDYRSFGQ